MEFILERVAAACIAGCCVNASCALRDVAYVVCALILG